MEAKRIKITNMDKEKQRARSANWDEKEKSLLTLLLKERIDVIENKDVSKNNNAEKKKAWQDILTKFNNLNQTQRTLSQLVNQWRNTKNIIKKRNWQYRQALNATGGGPPPPQPPEEYMEVIELIPQEFEVDHNMYDCDSPTTVKFNNSLQDVEEISDAQDAEIVCHEIQDLAFNEQETVKISEEKKPTPNCAPNLDIDVGPKKLQNTAFKKRNLRRNVTNDYEKEIFLLAKKERENAISYAMEEHKIKMEILELKKKYIQQKIEKLSEEKF